MQGLGATTARLATQRREALRVPPPTGGSAGTLVETERFGRNPGALRMLSYAPPGLAADAPLVVVLHGCTQRGESYAQGAGWLTLADRFGFAVLVPEQATANNFNRCFNWFVPDDAARGKGEAGSIRAMVAHMVRTHEIDPSRIFVSGLSAGGAMASVLLAAYPDVFAGGAIVAGLPYGVADNVGEALGAMHGRSTVRHDLGAALRRNAPPGGKLPRVSIWHGDADHTVVPGNAADIAAQWARARGLSPQPSEIEQLSGRTRAVWREAKGGEVLIESNLIRGMDHGTPLATRGPEGAGRAGPYMLEVGVSSSLESLRFWGVSPAAGAAAAATRPAGDRPTQPPKRPAGKPAPQPATIGDGVMRTVAAHVPDGVQAVIETALRKAGLMG